MIDPELMSRIEAGLEDLDKLAEKRAAQLKFPKVSREEQKSYIVKRLTESCRRWNKELTGIEDKYQAALREAKGLEDVPYRGEDLSSFCLTNKHQIAKDFGFFLSAMINNSSEQGTIRLDLRESPLFDYFGYKLCRNVQVQGDLGDNTAHRMERGTLEIHGNVHGVVGLYMGDPARRPEPKIIVHGSVRDVGAVRYSGAIKANRNEKSYYRFATISDVLKCLKSEPHGLFRDQIAQIERWNILDITDTFQRILHSDLVRISCGHNNEICDRQLREVDTRLSELGIETERINSDYANRLKNICAADGVVVFGAFPMAVFFPWSLIAYVPAYVGAELLDKARRVDLEEERNSRLESLSEEQRKHERLIADIKETKARTNAILYSLKI